MKIHVRKAESVGDTLTIWMTIGDCSLYARVFPNIRAGKTRWFRLHAGHDLLADAAWEDTALGRVAFTGVPLDPALARQLAHNVRINLKVE